MIISRTQHRLKRRRRIRSAISGTALRPRLCVHKSLRHLRVQLIDDTAAKTLASVSTIGLKTTAGVASAKQLGSALAEKAIALGIKSVVFDRGGYRYHGQIKALAEAARAGGLIF